MAEPEHNQEPGNAHPEGKKEEKKGPISLESAVNEHSQFAKGTANTAIGSGAIALATKYFGLDGLVTALSFPAGGMIEKRLLARKDGESDGDYEKRKKFTGSNFRDESIAGAAFTVPLWYGVNYERLIPGALGLEGMANVLGVGALTFATLPLFNAVYYPIKYLADNKTFKGMSKDFKENFWKGTKRSLYLGVPYSAAVAASIAVPGLYPFLFPLLAAFEVGFRVVLSKEKLDYSKLLNPFTYVPNFMNPFYVAGGIGLSAGKVYKGVAKGIYDLGSSVRSIFDSLSGSVPAPKKESAPHPA